MQDLWCCVGFLYGEGETMLSQDLIVAPTQSRPPALIEGSGRKARDRIEHFLRAAIDNNNTRKAYGRALGSFFAFLEVGGRERVQDIGPLDVRDYLEAAKANGLSTATLKQHMAAIRMLFDHLVTGGVLEHNPALSVKAPRQKLGKGKTPILTAEKRLASCCAPSTRAPWWGCAPAPPRCPCRWSAAARQPLFGGQDRGLALAELLARGLHGKRGVVLEHAAGDQVVE